MACSTAAWIFDSCVLNSRLGGVQVGVWRFSDRRGGDALNAEIAEVSGGVEIGQGLGRSRGGVGVMAGAVYRISTDGDQRPGKVDPDHPARLS